ncbi:MAG: CARDB domain-containing protein [Euryarchaeota archaeon]|nr:CARDB domain-containing protein [Euryarchaeota archaeon]
MIEVLIDYDKFQENDVNTIPEGAAYSRHHGGEYREWGNVEVRDTTHPVVYVAEGSHAAYFGPSVYYQIIGFDRANKGTERKISNDTLIIDQPWLNFGGNWGYVRPSAWQDGPLGPKYNSGGEKWYNPVKWAGIAEDPTEEYERSRFIVSLHCPADMYVTNSKGQITGTKDSEFIHEIPDSYVNSLGEEERYLVPANDVYNVEINGTGDGTFNFIPEYSSWNESRVFGYTDIPVTPRTTAYTEMSPTMTEYTLEIDHDGDNVIDETVTPNLGVSLSSPNAIQPLQPNTTLNYEIEITNDGNQQETFNLGYELPNDWTGSLSQDTVTVGPKETTTVTLSANVPDVEVKDYELRITASSEDGLNTFLTLIASAKPELTVSNLSIEYNENEVLLSCDASNLGLLDVNNVKVQFYNGKPENNNLIGEKTITLASEETKNINVPWNVEDGIYNVYAVIDPENAVSESAEYNNKTFKQFTIDRRPPEANIKFNTETQDIEVIGVDNIDENVDVSYEEYTEKFTGKHGKNKMDDLFDEIEDFGVPFNKIKRMRCRTYRIYTLTDDAGNTLKMKMLYLKLRRVIYTKIVELSYNEELTTPQRNAFGIVSIYRRGELKHLVQHLRVQRELVNVTYNARQDRSIIVTREGIEKREGLVLIVIGTEKGTLRYMLE